MGAVSRPASAVISIQTNPFSPKRSTIGEPASPIIVASPVRAERYPADILVPRAPMLSSSPASVSTTSPAHSARCSARPPWRPSMRRCRPSCRRRRGHRGAVRDLTFGADRPAGAVAQRIGVEMAVEHDPPARCAAPDPGDHIDDLGRSRCRSTSTPGTWAGADRPRGPPPHGCRHPDSATALRSAAWPDPRPGRCGRSRRRGEFDQRRARRIPRSGFEWGQRPADHEVDHRDEGEDFQRSEGRR